LLLKRSSADCNHDVEVGTIELLCVHRGHSTQLRHAEALESRRNGVGVPTYSEDQYVSRLDRALNLVAI
jgi:hypothetical protein